MNADAPLVSIVLPLYNGAQSVKNALESIVSQTYTHIEVIVVDDCSKDNSVQIVSDFFEKHPELDSRVIKLEKNSGSVQVPLVTGCSVAQGKYIARIDDDDCWSEPTKLQKQVGFLEMNEGYVALGTGVILVNEEGEEISRYLSPESDSEVRNQLLFRNCLAHPSVVFLKSILDEVGTYSLEKECKYVEDYDLWLRMGIVGKMANLPIYGITSIVSSGSESGRNKLIQLWRDLKLSIKYKNYYPKSFSAILFAAVRFFAYIPFSFLPKDLKTRINKVYKSK